MTKEELSALMERRKYLSIASVSAGPAVALLLNEAGADIDALLAEIENLQAEVAAVESERRWG